MTDEERFINIEMLLTEQQKMLDDLNDVIIFQQKEIQALKKEHKILKDLINDANVKALSEETPPPHY